VYGILSLIRSSIRDHASNKDFDPEALADERNDLRGAIEQWRIRHRTVFPKAFPHVNSGFPEVDVLELPSSYPSKTLNTYGLQTAAQFKYEIRIGHAYDAIENLRTSIHIYNACIHEKKVNIFGQRQTGCAWTTLNTLRADSRACAKRYRLAYNALLSLNLPADSELRPIGDDDLWGRDMFTTRKQGESKRKEPWYWIVGKPKDKSDVDWELERESNSMGVIYIH
jgi:hypothetical protein